MKPFHLTETGVVNNKQKGIQNNEILQSCMSKKNTKCATKTAPSGHQTHVVLHTHSETRINWSYTRTCNDMTITSDAALQFWSTLPCAWHPFLSNDYLYITWIIWNTWLNGTLRWCSLLVLQKRNYNLKILQLEVSVSHKPLHVISCSHTNLTRSSSWRCKCFISCGL